MIILQRFSLLFLLSSLFMMNFNVYASDSNTEVNQLKTDLDDFLRRVNTDYNEQFKTFKANFPDKYVIKPISVKDGMLENLKEDGWTVIKIVSKSKDDSLKKIADQLRADAIKIDNAISAIDDNMQEYIRALLKDEKDQQKRLKQIITENIKRLQAFASQSNKLAAKYGGYFAGERDDYYAKAIHLFADHIAKIAEKASKTTTSILSLMAPEKSWTSRAKNKIKEIFN